VDRRDFLRRAGIAGGVVWAAPTVTTVSRAVAQNGSPGPCIDEHCFGLARAVWIRESPIGEVILGEADGTPVSDCVAKADLPNFVSARVICARVFGEGDDPNIPDDGTGCGASAEIVDLKIGFPLLPAISVAAVETYVYNNPCPTGHVVARIVQLKIGNIKVNIPTDTTDPEGTVIILPANLARVAINQTVRSCEDELALIQHEVLRITVPAVGPPLLDVSIAFAQTSSSCCPCE
jgi:hypothetical protein